MKCPIKLNFKYSSSFIYIFFEVIFLSIDYFLDKANSLLIKKKCWNENPGEEETFNEKIFFSLYHKIFLVFSIFLYIIHKYLSKSKKKKLNKNLDLSATYIYKENSDIIKSIINFRIYKNQKFKILFYLTITLFLSIFFDCFQYFKQINLLYESIPFAFLSIIILNKYMVKDFYGKHQKYSIYNCILVTIIFQVSFYIYKIVNTDNSFEHYTILYIFNCVYFMFIGFKLSLFTYLNKTYFINAYELFTFEGVGYFIIILINFICCAQKRLNVIKNKGGSNYIVKEVSYNHFLFYLCRNITGFFIWYFFYLIICLNNLNNYIISDIISKFIYFITYKAYSQVKMRKKNIDDNNYFLTLVLNLIVFISSFIFKEIIIIKNKSFFRDTEEYLKNEEKNEIIELNSILNSKN